MVVVAQLVRAPDCGSGGRRFEPGHPPITPENFRGFFIKSVITHINNYNLHCLRLIKSDFQISGHR